MLDQKTSNSLSPKRLNSIFLLISQIFLNSFFLFAFLMTFRLFSLSSPIPHESLINFTSTSPLEVGCIGASTTGSLVEGCIGFTRKGSRHRFYCHSNGPTAGFLGSQTNAKPLSLKDQPGVFPAPLVAYASISFNFHCQDSENSFTPVVVRPDGTIFQGLPMTHDNSPQTLVISSPAQTGIYTLFVLSNQKEVKKTLFLVDASISTQPQNDQTISLKSFGNSEEDVEMMSAEFVYSSM